MDTALGLKFDIDEDLKHYKRGRIMTFQQLQTLPDDTVIWVHFRDDMEDDICDLDVNGAYRIVKNPEEENCWTCEDGSSFPAEVNPCTEDLPANGNLIWFNYSGQMEVFHAVKK